MPAPHPAPPRGNPQQILATVWQRNLPVVLERLGKLRAAAEMLQTAPLQPGTRLEATEIAHKLAGSLGMFGYPQGTEIARTLELLLDSETPLSPNIVGELTSQLEQVLNL